MGLFYRYITLHLRFITFDSFDAYPGHIYLTVPDHISVYTLSKMIIDQTDFATQSITIFRDKVRTRTNSLNPMLSLENYDFTGAYVNGTHNQKFPSYTLYYDYFIRDAHVDCPILNCDHYFCTN